MARLVAGENDFLTLYPEIAREWNFERNGTYLPSDFTSGSNYKAWWKCSVCGYEWIATIYSRSNGTGCPLCGKKKQAISFSRNRIEKNGSLIDNHPQLCLEWNYKKNKDQTPDSVSSGSNKKVWWICSRGHEWQATISSRVNGTNCPKCNAGNRTSLPEKAIVYYLRQCGFDLQENAKVFKNSKKDVDIYLLHLNIAIEYDGEHWHESEVKDIQKTALCRENGIKLIRIREPRAGSLEDGYSIEHFTGTPKNDLSYINEPIVWLLKFLNYADDIDVDANKDMSQIKAMIVKNYAEDSFGKIYPNIASEWDNEKNGALKPSDVSKSSGIRVWWVCEYSHSWQDTIAHRISGRGCPYCSGRRTLPGFNDLKTRCSSIAAEWDFEKNKGLSPNNISYRNGRKVWWICPEGHSYQATVAHRTEDNTGCPYCANQKVLIGYNDLLSQNPKVASEWNYNLNKGLSPSDFVVNSNKKVWWKCSVCENEWKAVISSRTIMNQGCPICGRRRGANQHHLTAIASNGSIKDNNPELIKEWNIERNGDKNPEDFTSGSRESVWWKCSVCGNEWKARISNRAILGRGCPQCGAKSRRENKMKRVLCMETNTVFDSVNSAALFAKVGASKISACCRGKQKTAGGYHWKYIDGYGRRDRE